MSNNQQREWTAERRKPTDNDHQIRSHQFRARLFWILWLQLMENAGKTFDTRFDFMRRECGEPENQTLRTSRLNVKVGKWLGDDSCRRCLVADLLTIDALRKPADQM